MTAQLSELRRQHTPPGDPAPDGTINADIRARSYLVSVALDYFGYAEIESWAQQHGVAAAPAGLGDGGRRGRMAAAGGDPVRRRCLLLAGPGALRGGRPLPRVRQG